MKHRRMAMAMAMVVLVLALLSGVLLALHADHACRQETCPICAVLAQTADILRVALAAAAIICLRAMLFCRRSNAPSERRFASEWMLIPQKVKFLN